MRPCAPCTEQGRTLRTASAPPAKRAGPPLPSAQLGANGLTAPVLSSLMDVLGKRGFVRLRCGVGGRERKALARRLEQLLDAAVVHDIGHTVTLYRCGHRVLRVLCALLAVGPWAASVGRARDS